MYCNLAFPILWRLPYIRAYVKLWKVVGTSMTCFASTILSLSFTHQLSFFLSLSYTTTATTPTFLITSLFFYITVARYGYTTKNDPESQLRRTHCHILEWDMKKLEKSVLFSITHDCKTWNLFCVAGQYFVPRITSYLTLLSTHELTISESVEYTCIKSTLLE